MAYTAAETELETAIDSAASRAMPMLYAAPAVPYLALNLALYATDDIVYHAAQLVAVHSLDSTHLCSLRQLGSCAHWIERGVQPDSL